MIKRFNFKNKNMRLEVFEFLKQQRDFDFYYTENNTRNYINTEQDLKNLTKDCIQIWFSKDKDVNGVAAVWVSRGGDTKRYYVKLTAKTGDMAEKLLDMLSWNFDKSLYAKLNKKNRFFRHFLYKGFKFKANRGQSSLLFREKVKEYTKKDK